jgi:hypothetical protein
MALSAFDRPDATIDTQTAGAPLLLWCTGAVALFAVLLFWLDPSQLLASLGDTDDATRLVEVRRLLSGASWYDMTLPRFGGAHPLVSHWSRLVDLPLALLLSVFELFVPPDKAEIAMRAAWPLLVLVAFAYLLARYAQFRGGRAAALIAILLAITCTFGIVQFFPGRIDHHNVMILGAVAGVLWLARSFDVPAAGWSAGVLLGLGTAVGYEALALTVVALGLSVLYALLPGRSLLGPSRTAVTFAATLAISLSLTKSPPGLLASHCDALSLNLVLLAGVAAFGVCMAQAFEERVSAIARLAILIVSGAIGLVLYASADPACLAGPFGEVDPRLFPLWLGGVSETQSMLSFGQKLPAVAALALLYFAAGAYCGFRLMRGENGEGLRFHMLAFLAAIVLSFWQIKLLPYAAFLSIPFIASYLAQPHRAAQGPMRTGDLAMIAAGSMIVLALAAYVIATLTASGRSQATTQQAAFNACRANAAFLPLARLPKGLAVADVNLGPYLVALTDLDALSAPYHRLDKSITEAHRILHASPAEAEAELRRAGAAYVVTCNDLDMMRSPNPVPSDALVHLLAAGKAPAFLAPVPLYGPTPYKVWRVKPAPSVSPPL